MKPISYLWEKFVVARARAMMLKHRPDGQKMAVIAGDYLSLKAMLQGRFEARLIDVLEQRVLPGLGRDSVCLDIGANIGNHSIVFARWFAEVYAFEPNPAAFDVLSLNAKWAGGRIRAVNLGASDRGFVADAVAPAENLGAARITGVAPAGAGDGEGLRFACVRVDEYLPEDVIPRVSFIKLDVEGHEYEALSGCERIIERARPLVAFELLRKDHDSNGARIRGLLERQGYRYFYDAGRGLAPISRIRRRNYKMILASCDRLEA